MKSEEWWYGVGVEGKAVGFKICGLRRASDVRVAEEAGASYGGIILAPGSPRTVSPQRVAEIFVGSSLPRCGVFVNESLDRVSGLAAELGLAAIQLHGDETPEFAAQLRARVDGAVWKAIRPRSGDEFAEAAARYAGAVDALLLDGWSPGARGGTGSRFPWQEVARHRDGLGPRVRLVVAGGLTPENVGEAIALLSPDIVDVSSGVERTAGIKAPESIRRFAAAVSAAAGKREGN